ncbi:hypothetical protein RAJCM14343_2486 [Rhodococcus aetherivorans]|uniref:Uncharacterized protein n=1 Tax=Rhodococcus aetherivorans TaxID=191292 RepID=A0ABQ0YKZ5_9NOCA|nr:hypothetical protein RAJCM14343_2486 [Rhodococcus aetherivorans]CCW15604.1 hypothetical protein EBESD8_61810 [Rhodococcus aetherivorans]
MGGRVRLGCRRLGGRPLPTRFGSARLRSAGFLRCVRVGHRSSSLPRGTAAWSHWFAWSGRGGRSETTPAHY